MGVSVNAKTHQATLQKFALFFGLFILFSLDIAQLLTYVNSLYIHSDNE